MNLPEIARIHAKTHQFQAAVNNAGSIIRRALAEKAGWYVAFSGGKDSTVVAALVREQYPEVPLIWSDDEWFFPETAEYMAHMENLHHIRTNAWHAEWFQISGDWKGIPDYANSKGWHGAFLGLRQEESGKRRVYLRTYGPLHFAEKNRQWQCNPIHNWTWRDVWAYIHTKKLDYNRAYDRMNEIGVEPQQQRIGPFAVERALGYGQLAILKRGWPDLFNRFAEKYPEAHDYV